MRALLIPACALLLACGEPDSQAPTDPIEAKVRALLSSMTIEEKVTEKAGLALGAFDDLFHAGGNERLGIPPFKMVDGPRGVRAGHATAFPVGMARGATWDVELERRVGIAIGREARAKGANVILAPVVNVLRHPAWGRAQETYGEDPFHLGEMGAAFVEGAQTEVIASVKHFALNSIEDSRFTVNVTADERTLREIYLRAFQRVVGAGVGSVMSAYNRVNGTYCSENAHLLREILKDEWGFAGFVESDWVLGTNSTVEAANAGLDIEMPVAAHFGDALLEAVRTGRVKAATVDESVGRILRTKLRFEIEERPPLGAEVVESDEHLALALEVARRSIVLLKNEAALPLDRSALSDLAVVGALANVANLGDHGSSAVTPSRAVTPLAGIEAAAGAARVHFVASSTLSVADRDTIASAGAAIVVVGLTDADEGENVLDGTGDRAELGLSAEHALLIDRVAALNPRTIVVLEGGSALTMDPWLDGVEAVLMAWYPGLEGGTAIGEILFGDVNPSGKLPISFAARAADLPEFSSDRDEVTYGYYHGYRHLDHEAIAPLFPFGFGLSYTTFRYGTAQVTKAEDGSFEASVELENAGARSGIEIAQLYLSYAGSSVERPVRELKSFAAVELDPGERTVVAFVLAPEQLAYFDAGANQWMIEPIEYRVEIGGSSRDLPAVASFTR